MTMRKILVIDDEEDICEMTKLVLERAGHQVECLTDSRLARRRLEEKAFDVVITDMLMPEKDGLEVMTDLRREHPKVRIIATSGGGRISSNSYLHIAQKSGAHALLSKPFSSEELMASLAVAFQPPPATQPATRVSP